MTKTKSLTAPQLWTVLAKCHRSLTQLVEHSIGSTGLCLSDFMVLEALIHKGPLTITEIQGKILLASGSMTAAIDRVEKKGLIVRKTTTEDRRARVLELTVKGRKIAETAFKSHAADLEALFSALSEAEKIHLYGPLRKLGYAAAERMEQLRNAGEKH